MDEKNLFEREMKVMQESKAFLAQSENKKNPCHDHCEKLVCEFERVVRYCQRLIRIGDMMQLQLKTLKEELSLEIENHKKTQAEKDLCQAQFFQAQKMESLGTLVGGIAHDFNNMLQIILGYTQILLLDKKNDDPAYNYLQTIIQTVETGAELVNKLLAFGQQAPIFPISLDVNDMINDLVPVISRTLPQVIKIEVDLTNDPTTIYADPNQIAQVILNLAINASEAMPNGGRVKITTANVSLDNEYCMAHPGVKTGDYVKLSLADSGQGIGDETLDRIFEPFFSTKQKGATRGTGLGLSVVQGIVLQQGGHVTCESKLGTGTEFRIYFPSVASKIVDDGTVVSATKIAGTKTILVVEDNIKIADLERKFLTNAGYRVVVTNNGQEAIDVYQTRKDEISMVILDLLLPEMSSKDCLMKLIKIDPSVKALIVSGFSTGDKLHEEIRSLAKGFVQKPFGVIQLLEEVRSVLRN